MNGLWCFTFGHTFWCLLDFNMLFVREERQVMIKDEGMRFVATCAESWFSDFALLDETTLFLLAGDASEGCFFHFRNYVTATDYDTTKSY